MCDDASNINRTIEAPDIEATARGAWVMLTQYTRHSSYGGDTSANRARALSSFHEHYNVRFSDPVYILSDQGAPMTPPYPYVRFRNITSALWQVPVHVRGSLKSWAYPNKFSTGYRQMIRFFALGIWIFTVVELGYRWVARLDDDSRILSHVPFHIFTFMERHGFAYGYRNIALETPWWGEAWHTFLRQFPSRNATWILDQCPNATRASFTKSRCGEFRNFYNNFFVADAARMLANIDIQTFLNTVDDSGYMFTRRWGDLNIHSAAIQLYIPRDQVHRFTSFSYYHNQYPNRLKYGIAQRGFADDRPITSRVPWKNPVWVFNGMQTVAFLEKGGGFGLC